MKGGVQNFTFIHWLRMSGIYARKSNNQAGADADLAAAEI